MKKKGICITVGAVLCAVSLFVSTPALAVDMKEGKWEHTMEMKMEGMPMEIPMMPITTTECLSQKDIVPQTAQKEKEQNCKILDQKITGNKVIWKVKCVEKGSVTEGEGEITYSGTTYAGTLKTKITDKSGQVMRSTTKMKGRRIGDCK
ncbi:MAG: DUF3617 family protein [Nitrospirae bacterium]|nr:DUF3617 family protein [Nitrospirota bacterium]